MIQQANMLNWQDRVMNSSELAGIGDRLRQARRRRDMSLTEVSELTGISPSTLSRLESGQRRPHLDLLLPIARAIGASLDDLVGTADGDPRIRPRPHRRPGVVITPLSRPDSSAYVAHMRFAAETRAADPRVHDGRDWVYVLSGRLRLVLGDQDLVLEPGEAAEFPTTTPHWMGSTGAGPVEVLTIFGPHGERTHLRTIGPGGIDGDVGDVLPSGGEAGAAGDVDGGIEVGPDARPASVAP